MSEPEDTTAAREEEQEKAMLTAARSVVMTCMQLRSVEAVLVITDPESSEVGSCLLYTSPSPRD